ncbi:hypothetical protein NBRC116590_28100 [Pelagimonas sp. KU-00592-HH]|uniref:hypothetical protein n=1 Tax=Pelagimonas sp. KU-00592-HH TaxID=3127651 RepID=UPI00310B4564
MKFLVRTAAVFAAIASLSACSSDDISKEQQLALFDRAPTKEELNGYYKQSITHISGNTHLHILVKRNYTSLDSLYADVEFSVRGYSFRIDREEEIPEEIMARFSHETKATAASQKTNEAYRSFYLKFAKQLAEQTICFGKRAVSSDRGEMRVSDPESIQKIIAANNGQVLGANTKGLKLKKIRVPVVDFRYSLSVPKVFVRLKCV